MNWYEKARITRFRVIVFVITAIFVFLVLVRP